MTGDPSPRVAAAASAGEQPREASRLATYALRQLTWLQRGLRLAALPAAAAAALRPSRRGLGHLAAGTAASPPLPQVIDVSAKAATAREAVARASLRVSTALPLRAWWPAGDAAAEASLCATASVAGALAAKRTAELLPMCHGLALEHCAVVVARPAACSSGSGSWVIAVTATARTLARTGVEMEALLGASIGALTLYDMLKGSVTHGALALEQVQLLRKSGGSKPHSAAASGGGQ